MTDPSPRQPRPAPDDAADEPPPRRGALVALIVLAVLLVGGLWLSRALHETGKLQDCVMAGRTNCAPIGK